MNFEFPDPADFPENDAPAFPDDINVDDWFEAPFFFDEDMKNLKELILNQMNPSKEARGIIDKQMNRIKRAATAYRRELALKPNPASHYTGPKDAIDGLVMDGIFATKADTSGLARFYKTQIDSLMGAQPMKGIAVYDRAIQDNSATSRKEVQTFLDGLGLMKAASWHRRGNDVNVTNVTVHVSKPGDQHHSQQFKDCETKTKLLNLHFDPKPGILKCIIYLNDVDESNGPFKYVPGSPYWDYDEIERIFAWGNSTSNYCHTPVHREAANAFPKRFRKNAIVGRLIPDGTELSDTLLKAEKAYLSDEHNVMLFSPTYGLHRGGQCETGKRVNLQVVLK